MENIRLTEERVHALIEAYAKENNGDIPSSKMILELNDEHGSLQSANRYRKSYIRKHPTKNSEGADPLAGFPAAIADAVKEMRATLEAEAQIKITEIEKSTAKAIEDMQAKLDSATSQLLASEERTKSLTFDLRKVRRDNETLADENQMLRQRLDNSTKELGHIKILLERKESETKGLLDRIQDLENIRDDIKLLTESVKAQSHSYEKLGSKLLTDTESLREGHQASQKTVKAQLDGLATVFAQGYESLTKQATENRDAISTSEKHHQQYQQEITRQKQTIEEQRILLEQERQANIELTQDALSTKLDQSHELIVTLVESMANLHTNLPSDLARALKNLPKG